MLAMANAGNAAAAAAPTARSSSSRRPTTWLQGKHTIFGEVADDDSRAVVDAIEAVATDGRDRPLEDVVIESITIDEV